MATSAPVWYQFQTYPTWDIPLNTDQGPDDLTGVSISTFQMIFRSSTGTDRTGTGTFTLKIAYPAEILYKPSAADVANTFVGSLIIKAYYPPSNSSADTIIFDPVAFQITAS